MILELTFKTLITSTFGEDGEKVATWMSRECVLSAEDFSMLACEEKEVDASIIAPAKAAGVHEDALKHRVAFKKLWRLCKADDSANHGQAENAESEEGLPEKARKSSEATWLQKHGYALPPGRRLVSTHMGPMHAMAHILFPNLKDFLCFPCGA